MIVGLVGRIAFGQPIQNSGAIDMIGLRTLLFMFIVTMAPVSALAQATLDWRSWSQAEFASAKSQNKLVLLDLKAVWCHWCHVMDTVTYKDPEVVRLLNTHFVVIRADQDANPDLSSRYGDWGWPATILFTADGGELAKIRGYRDPEQMASILTAFIKEPTPGPSVEIALPVIPATQSFLAKEQRTRILSTLQEVYDKTYGGWGGDQKFIHTDAMDFALTQAAGGDAEANQSVRQTLDAALALMDKEWGGLFQYSDQPDWRSPHYEKIMWYQAQGLRQYAQAYGLLGDSRYRDAARAIAGYLNNHLKSPDGAFFTSQDADFSPALHGKEFYALSDSARRKLGEPPIDRNIYSRENGWAITGLAAFSDMTGDQAALEQAITAARWIITNRSIAGGGFTHGAKDRAGPYLGDTLAMGEAFLALYGSTGDRTWLERAMAAGDFIAARFKARIGFSPAQSPELDTGAFLVPALNVEEQGQVARFFNLLHRYAGKERFGDLADHAMRYLASDHVTGMPRLLAGVLLADEQLAIEPMHVTVVGHRDDPKAADLHRSARAIAEFYRRIDWWDTREGPMINTDVQYPELDEAAAFACSAQLCSRPAFSGQELAQVLSEMAALRVTERR